MVFLYGDGSPSPLALDYLGYLRRVMALAVEVVLAEDQLLGAARRRRALQARTRDLEARLEALQVTARRAVEGVARSPVDDPVTRCANHIESAIDDVVARAVADVRAQDEAAAADIAGRERTAHRACLDAVETFVRDHDFPDASVELELAPAGAGHGVIARAMTPYHVASEVELDVRGSPFATAEVRAGSLMKTRLSEAKLDKLLVVRARCDARAIEARLRVSREPGADGFDVALDRSTGAARLTRIRRPGVPDAVDLGADDERAVAALATTIAGALDALAANRLRLRSVTLDDVPLDEHDRPSVLVDRVFAAIAPQVRTIVERSKVPGELSLRRDLGNGTREEIFVTHAALAELVAQVPVARRRHFDALGIPGLPGGRRPGGHVPGS